MPRLVGSAPTQTRLAFAGHGQERLEPRVGVDLDRLLAAIAPGREQVAGDVAGGDAVVAEQAQTQVDEVLADAGAAFEQIAHRRVDVGGALPVLEPVGDQLGDEHQHPQRRLGRAGRGQQLGHRGVGAGVVGLEEELAPGLAVVGVGERLPRRLRGLGRRPGAHACAHVDRQPTVRPRDLELDHFGAEVVGVAVQPDLGGQPHAELVAALPGVIAGLTRSAFRLSATSLSYW